MALADALFPGVSLSGDVDPSAVEGVIEETNHLGNFVFGIAVLLCVFFLLMSFAKFSAAGDNEQDRKMALQAILGSGVALALLGGFGMLLSIFSSLL